MKILRSVLLLVALTLPAAAWAQVPDSLNPYVRKPRNAAVSAEIGLNSLSSLVGLKGSFFVSPQFIVDAGLGLSYAGLRPGVYARYLFSKAKFTPFAYGGLKYGLGSGGEWIPVEDPDSGDEYALKVKPSPFLDLGFGIDYLAHNGFYLTASLGWSQLLGGKNFEWEDGSTTDDLNDAMTFILGSGPAFSLSLGYAF